MAASFKLEITSPGKLHFGIKIEDLYGKHESKLWNPLIAAVFYRRGVIETWGRGTNKMAELAAEAGLSPPEFEERTGSLVVRFQSSRYKAPGRIGHDLTERQQSILSVLGNNDQLSLKDIRESIGGRFAPRTLRQDLFFLKKLNLASYKGKGRASRWFLKGKKNRALKPK